MIEDKDLIKFGEIRRRICQKDPKKKVKKRQDTQDIGENRREKKDGIGALMLKLHKSCS